MPFWGMLIGAGAGVVKNEMVDRPAADRARKLAATTQEYSPWTGLKADPVKDPNVFNNALQFGATGAEMGQNIEASKYMKAHPGAVKLNFNVGSSLPSQAPNAISGLNYGASPSNFWGSSY